MPKSTKRSSTHFLLPFLCLLLAAFSEPASAFVTDIEPVIGYERVQKLVPVPHTKERLVYGVRVTGGVAFVAAEAELLRGTDTQQFPLLGSTVEETEDKARLGLRGRINMGKTVRFFLRGGAQASRSQRVTTLGAVTTTETDPIRYNPYAGAGFRFRISSKFSFTADVTTVFRDFPDFSQNEYMTTAGFSVSFP